jgi:hypothetical protein
MPAAYQYGAGISGGTGGGTGYETWGTPNNVQNNQGQANTGYTPYTPTNIFSAGGSATPTPSRPLNPAPSGAFGGRPDGSYKPSPPIPGGQTQQPTASAQQPAAAAPQDTGFTYDPEGGSLLNQLSSAYGGQTHQVDTPGRGLPGFTQGFTDFFTGEGYYADPRATYGDGAWDISDKPIVPVTKGGPSNWGPSPRQTKTLRQTTSLPPISGRQKGGPEPLEEYDEYGNPKGWVDDWLSFYENGPPKNGPRQTTSSPSLTQRKF